MSVPVARSGTDWGQSLAIGRFTGVFVRELRQAGDGLPRPSQKEAIASFDTQAEVPGGCVDCDGVRPNGNRNM